MNERFKIVEHNLCIGGYPLISRTFYEARTIKSAQKKLNKLVELGRWADHENPYCPKIKAGVYDRKTEKFYDFYDFDNILDEEDLEQNGFYID